MNKKSSELLLSHPLEQKMGITYYASKEQGIHGKIRVHPKDFQVEEILPDGRIVSIDDEDFSLGDDEPGLYTEFVLIKRNIESHAALYKITSALKLNIKDIDIAGTKDKTAYTAQRSTIWRVPAEKLLKLELKGITIRSPRTTIYKTYLGDLKGNHFTIKVREFEDSEAELKEKIDTIRKEIDSFSGIPNYFGHQRFGTRRPISYLIGKNVMKENYEEAIRIYLSYQSEYEFDKSNEARRIFGETNDPEMALKLIPKNLIFERMILKRLSKNPKDFIGAFLTLPKNMQRIFVHSYQSYIWNKMLSERIRIFEDLTQQEIDIIENNEQVLPIVGYDTNLADNVLSDYVNELFEEDNIKQKHFLVERLPALKFPGLNRRIKLNPKDFGYSTSLDSENNTEVTFQFSLTSGSYATVILREFMKASPLVY
ncbi:MAG: tRNA pseudouridine(13) synthase TruD [Asgard group archaeon]|nr:tRNA pseudouridine(13) synthase TruD [Asgard group archaeon]